MLTRPWMIDSIRADYVEAKMHGLDHLDALLYARDENPDPTTSEMVNGIYGLHAYSLKVDKKEIHIEKHQEILYLGGKDLYRMDKHKIAKDNVRFPDERIISAKRIYKDPDGNEIPYRAQVLAKGQDALNKDKERERLQKAIEVERADYRKKGHDPELEHRLRELARKRAAQVKGGKKKK